MFDTATLRELQNADLARETNQALDAIASAAALKATGCALPQNFRVEDLEQYAPVRRRARGSMKTSDIESFQTYVHAIVGAPTARDDEDARAFVDDESMRAVTVLDFGQPTTPGHCDNLAILTAKTTAEYNALAAIRDQPKSQRDIAEFLEDWSPNITCFGGEEGIELGVGNAASAVRRLTIEAARKQEHVDQSLSASRSTFESVTASSSLGLPNTITFRCVPYLGLGERDFALRLSVRLSDDKPTLVLRSIKLDAVKQEMAAEFAGLVATAMVVCHVPVIRGVYAAVK